MPPHFPNRNVQDMRNTLLASRRLSVVEARGGLAGDFITLLSIANMSIARSRIPVLLS